MLSKKFYKQLYASETSYISRNIESSIISEVASTIYLLMTGLIWTLEPRNALEIAWQFPLGCCLLLNFVISEYLFKVNQQKQKQTPCFDRV